ncbi:gamma-glutamylcyclotransferase (GGCT)/AIG2-like uncharacterized protein YtfP [Bacillus tianshenii]|uniref:Gamma-glutamylcyclotransferase (GGCT)/AIG2-like uncharacterized protein YtfP n=1 Tax=Sutcliffiella tianshenii TaxID=1463404 RepID=A0ABS2NZH2_9BACI|nr:gamma-glutamylcyclotransferase family protein [Bacillus tianshenii]MBM7620031.1 gamma-glutamylcyclotransferase (GGCT)/AIG2-like uncharacterized protein YtfP [Bacillus tianshenii]
MNVFVYGTLRKGERNAGLLRDAKCVAEQSWTEGRLYDTRFGYPAVKPGGGGYVYGELYEIREVNLDRLDRLEGYMEGGVDNLFERVEQTIYTDKGTVSALVYVGGRSEMFKQHISGGDWKEYTLNTLKQQRTVRYFAYGSCMDMERISNKGFGNCFRNVLGVGVLPNYSLKFTRKSTFDDMGRADIVEDGCGVVEGKVYEIPVSVLDEYLYGRELAPGAYRPTFVTVKINGAEVQVLTFVVVNKEPETAPPLEYEVEIFRGAAGYLSEAYLEALKHHIDSLRKQGAWGGGSARSVECTG